MLSAELYFSSSDEEENCTKIRKELRDSSDPLQLPETTFIKLFRINKEAFVYIIQKTENFFKKNSRCSSVPIILKLAAALRLLADGGYQKGVGQDFYVSVCQSTASVIINEVLNVLENKLCPLWVSFTQSAIERQEVKSHFFEKFGFPGIIGCVDGTHIRIIAPSENEHLFFNRKGYHSLNTMIVCDHKMKILAVDGRYGGASHDSHIWGLSDVKRFLQDFVIRNRGERNWLLGDSGYPNEPWLIIPFRSVSEGSRRATFNEIHSKCRNIVERTIGLLKARFRCLLSFRALHYSPEKTVRIVNVCTALHNICLHFNTENFEEIPENLNTNSNETEYDNGSSTSRDVIFNSIVP